MSEEAARFPTARDLRAGPPAAREEEEEIAFSDVICERDLPGWLDRDELALFFHHKMKPYHDRLEDVQRALDYVFSPDRGKGGFIILAHRERSLVGGVVIMRTGMEGYVPPNILLFVVVDPALRGQGLGRRIIEMALSRCQGDVKLHVEQDNPARRLYERIGFTCKYMEMRYKSPPREVESP